MDGRRPRLWPSLAVIAASLAVYAPVLRGGFIWDDDAYVWRNAALRSAGGLARIWLSPGATEQYWPMTYTAFWAEFHLWGLGTFGYHLVNALLHAANAVLAGLVLERLRVRGAWLAALIFAVHPVELESVAWITELKNVLSGFFYLSALLAFLDYEDSGEAGRRRHSVGLFTCAVLCKSVTCTLAAALPLLAWARRGRVGRREWLAFAPFWGIGLAMGSVTMWVERAIAGASGPLFAFDPLQRLAIAGRALCFYLGKLAWPSPLVFIYPRWDVPPWPGLQLLWPAAVLAALAALWLARRRLGRWPLAALLYFALTLAPALGFVSLYTMRFSFVADHFQYLASLGPIALVAAFLSKGLDRLRGLPLARAALPALLVADLALVSWGEGRKYRGDAALWLDTLEKNPSCAMAHHEVGILLAAKGDYAQAAGELGEAARLDPTLVQTQLALAYVWKKLGRPERAERPYRNALALGAGDSQVRADFARLEAELGRKAPAEATSGAPAP